MRREGETAVVNPVLLTGYDAKRCARRIHNEWDPALETEPWEVPAELQMRFDAGREFEQAVIDELKAELSSDRWVHVSGPDETIAAMDRGAEVIIGACLPNDVNGGRSGRPDLLLRVEGGYVPGDVKGHLITHSFAKGVVVESSFSNPSAVTEVVGRRARTGRFEDFLQLAHYWRMLEAMDRAGGTPRGVIIGTDTPHALTWLRLDEPLFETYSRSEGKKTRTALDRYDHEFGFRFRVATVAAAGQDALVQPIFTDECDSCPWLEYCESIAGDVASAQITSGRLTVREWKALAALGISSLDDMADLVVDSDFEERYLPEVAHLGKPLDRVRTASRRARMIRDGVMLERETSGAIDVPRADVEVDLDIEWDGANGVYLWGVLATVAGESTYQSLVDWGTDVDDLAAEFAEWLRAQIAEADAVGKSLLVYHYSPAEVTHLKRLLGSDLDFLDRFVDLLPIVKRHYFGVNGHGIKAVAPAFGFEWRDDEPGGLQSQVWLQEARGALDPEVRDAARQRILDYNEDDVRATLAVREGLGRA